MSNEELIALYGTMEPPVELQELRAGKLSLMLEGGNLRYIRYGGIEVLRAISFLVRDTKWGTYNSVFNNVKLIQTDDHFHLTYEAICSGPEGRFDYQTVIQGAANGTLSFAATGASTAEFPTNRVGFVVLHPLEGVAGSSVQIGHVDGTAEQLILSLEISPDQPSTNIRSITHCIGGLTVRVKMEGDAFEMEDHRNWTDASYKTYVRPLSKPRPFVIPAHSQITQSIKVEISGSVTGKQADASTLNLSINGFGPPMPELGLGFDVQDTILVVQHMDLLKKLGLKVIVARYDQIRQHNDILTAVSNFAAKLSARVNLEALIPGVDTHTELKVLAQACTDSNLKVSSILVSPARDIKTRPSNNLPKGEASAAEIAIAAKAAFPGIKIGGGMLTFFTEFNRNRPSIGDIDFVSHSTAGNIHAADDISVMETLEALDHVMRSVRKICCDLPYRIGPSAIGLSENPYGPTVAENPLQRRITMARRDPRHRGLFGAAWTLGYIAVAIRHNVELLTLAHCLGDFGVLNDDGALRPIYHVLRGIAHGLDSKSLNVNTGSEQIAALGFAGKSGAELWLANKTAIVQSINLQSIYQIARLDAGNFEKAASNPDFLDHVQFESNQLQLPPFAVVRIWTK